MGKEQKLIMPEQNYMQFADPTEFETGIIRMG